MRGTKGIPTPCGLTKPGSRVRGAGWYEKPEMRNTIETVSNSLTALLADRDAGARRRREPPAWVAVQGRRQACGVRRCSRSPGGLPGDRTALCPRLRTGRSRRGDGHILIHEQPLRLTTSRHDIQETDGPRPKFTNACLCRCVCVRCERNERAQGVHTRRSWSDRPTHSHDRLARTEPARVDTLCGVQVRSLALSRPTRQKPPTSRG